MMLIQVALTLLIIICKRIVKPCKNNCIASWVRKEVHYKIFVLRFFLESCVELGLAAMIQVLSVSLEVGFFAVFLTILYFIQTRRDIFEHADDTVSYCLSIMTLVSLIAAPIIFAWLTRRFIQEMAKPEEEQKIKSETRAIFESYRTDSCQALFYPFVFFMRRYVMILVLTLLTSFRIMQI